jgi:hypothetical protein
LNTDLVVLAARVALCQRRWQRNCGSNAKRRRFRFELRKVSAGGGLLIDGGGSDDGALTTDTACVGETKQAEKIPLAMYILLDKSGSMINSGSPKWSQAVNAINTFASDQSLVAVKVALQAWSGQGPCDGSIYDTPAIPMSPVPTSAPQIASWLAGIYPDGNTPTQGALVSRSTPPSTRARIPVKVIGLLITDGCPRPAMSRSPLWRGSQDPLSRFASILVYTMGMRGADFGLLDSIAQAAAPAKRLTRPRAVKRLIDALQTISGSALSASSRSDTGKWHARSRKGQRRIHPERAASSRFTRSTTAACVQWGWYYDDPSSRRASSSVPRPATRSSRTPWSHRPDPRCKIESAGMKNVFQRRRRPARVARCRLIVRRLWQ